MSAKEVMAKRGEWKGAAQESKSVRSTPLARFMAVTRYCENWGPLTVWRMPSEALRECRTRRPGGTGNFCERPDCECADG